jgi:cell division protein FtsA
VADLVLSPLAAARACLSDDELDMGVGLIDIGGGTADVVCFEEGAVVDTCVVPVGGQQVTGDLAVCLRTTWNHAETLKCQFALSEDDALQVARVAGRSPERVAPAEVWEIVEARLDELFGLVRQGLDLQERQTPRAGFVLTGGSCQLEQMATVAERVLGASTRIASPSAHEGVGDVLAQPEWSTAVGLVLTTHDAQSEGPTQSTTRFDSAAGRMRSWLEGLL